MRRLVPGLAAVALCLLAHSAWAEPEGLREARNRFEFGQYGAAIEEIEKLDRQHELTTEAELIDAWRMHALASYYLGRQAEARASFLRLLKIAPDYLLDPVMVAPPATALLEQVRQEERATLDPIRAERRAIVAARHEPSVGAVIERTPFAMNLLPLGIPQFYQGRVAAGTAFAVGQGLALATCLVAAYEFRSLRRIDGTFAVEDFDRARAWRTTNWVGFGATAALYLGGVADAAVNHQGERRIEPSRSPAPGLLATPRLSAAPTPGGFSVAIRGAF